MSQSPPGQKRAYYFSTPILYKSNNRPVRPQFQKIADFYYFKGSNCEVKITDGCVTLYNDNEKIFLHLNESRSLVHSDDFSCLRNDSIMIFPSFNGIIIKHRTNKTKFKIESSCSSDIRNNTKYFAFMRSNFEPIVTVNAMFAENRYRDVFYNVILNSRKITKSAYDLELCSVCENSFQLTYEINMYEPKLIQDTTVESNHPNENNLFGDIAFLGKSSWCGNQFLYLRIDDSKIDLQNGLSIDKVRLHIPYYTTTAKNFRISVPMRRFCNFGSTWNNKIPYSNAISSGTKNNGYITFDISKYVISKAGKWTPCEGFVLQSPGEHFSIIGTGDNYYTPQVLEITYK